MKGLCAKIQLKDALFGHIFDMRRHQESANIPIVANRSPAGVEHLDLLSPYPQPASCCSFISV